MMIRSYDHAKKWKEKHLVIVHGIEITGAITSCHQLIEKHTGFWAQYAIVVPPGAKCIKRGKPNTLNGVSRTG